MPSDLWQRVDSRFNQCWTLRSEWRSLMEAPSTELGTPEWIQQVLTVWRSAREVNAPFADPTSPMREFNTSVGRMLEIYNSNCGGTQALKENNQPTLEEIERVQLDFLQAEYHRACLETETGLVRPGDTSHLSQSWALAQKVHAINQKYQFLNALSEWPEDDHAHDCICKIFHSGGIPGCYYCIPELRPRNFVIRDRVQNRVDQQLEQNPQMAVYIAKARVLILNNGELVPPYKAAELLANSDRFMSTGSDNVSHISAKTDKRSAAIAPPSTELPIRSVVAGPKSSIAGPPHPLQKSWVLSIATDVCICNNKESLAEFVPAEAGKVIEIHGQTLTVLGSGKAEVDVKTIDGTEQIVTFSDVLCVPGYYTNLVSLDALEDADITWNHANDFLVLEGEAWCKIDRLHGMRVIHHVPL